MTKEGLVAAVLKAAKCETKKQAQSAAEAVFAGADPGLGFSSFGFLLLFWRLSPLASGWLYAGRGAPFLYPVGQSARWIR